LRTFYSEDRGVTACAETLPDGRLSLGEGVLEEKHHFSSPFLFRHEGETLMIPECPRSGRSVFTARRRSPIGGKRRKCHLQMFPRSTRSFSFATGRTASSPPCGSYRRNHLSSGCPTRSPYSLVGLRAWSSSTTAVTSAPHRQAALFYTAMSPNKVAGDATARLGPLVGHAASC